MGYSPVFKHDFVDLVRKDTKMSPCLLANSAMIADQYIMGYYGIIYVYYTWM